MIPLSKIKAKYIKSLQLKKNRDKEKRFLVEGRKSVLEFLHSDYRVVMLVGTEEFYDQHSFPEGTYESYLAKSHELATIGSLKSNNAAIAIFAQKEITLLSPEQKGIILALDGINDPGNLGTIIRTADWFGVKTLLLNDESVDPYNPKVINASKGSMCRVMVYEQSLVDYLKAYPLDVFAADMNGISLDKIQPVESGMIIMGNESHGIQSSIEAFITKKITIPSIGHAESLNVGVATGIVCYSLIKSA